MDPVVAGAVVTVLVSIMSGVVKIMRYRFSARVELARIVDAGVTERVRHTVPWGALQEHTEGRTVQAGPRPGGGAHHG
ncbi:hypothetical protein HHL19_17885 [Streptomyces sp. R302]|uniref:hypothetical protein n=1 Tax=unclassified Streptomyces TaxID=2593676 RepID=UPI00145D7979|nr:MULTISPECIES: hypothetical protein [unclassified Streptomyces]NML52567.1 hypothetical protein [Streptomyces sp. R301]NML80504.1 hypothetical protein [Streptomyces sp. R302]